MFRAFNMGIGLIVVCAAADADATLSGDAGAVLLALWNRLPYPAVGTTGEESALAALQALVAVTTQ